MGRDGKGGGRFDWADLAVPLAASIFYVTRRDSRDPVVVLGDGIGYALAVAVVFVGVRQVLWALNQRRPEPRPRQPVLAALVGMAVWAFIILRHR